MASRIKAIKTLQASIQPRRTAKMRDMVEHMQRRIGLNKGEVLQALMGLRDPLVYFYQGGQATKVPGIGTTPPLCMHMEISK